MAACERLLYIEMKMRWWTRAYVALVTLFVWSIAFALDDDDPRLAAFMERQGQFIAKHGFWLKFTDQDPGELSGLAQE